MLAVTADVPGGGGWKGWGDGGRGKKQLLAHGLSVRRILLLFPSSLQAVPNLPIFRKGAAAAASLIAVISRRPAIDPDAPGRTLEAVSKAGGPAMAC